MLKKRKRNGKRDDINLSKFRSLLQFEKVLPKKIKKSSKECVIHKIRSGKAKDLFYKLMKKSKVKIKKAKE